MGVEIENGENEPNNAPIISQVDDYSLIEGLTERYKKADFSRAICVFGVVVEGKVVGFASLVEDYDFPGYLYVDYIYVDSQYRQKGLAMQLAEMQMKFVRNLGKKGIRGMILDPFGVGLYSLKFATKFGLITVYAHKAKYENKAGALHGVLHFTDERLFGDHITSNNVDEIMKFLGVSDLQTD